MPTDLPASEFARSLERHFRFLVDEFGYERGHPARDNEGTRVAYANGRMRVQMRYEGGGSLYDGDAVYLDLVPLDDGKVPPKFDEQLHERLTSFALESVMRLYDDDWTRSPKAEAIRSMDDLDEVLASYAEALRTYGRAALRGDRAVFERAAERARANLIRTYTDDWARFVSEVGRGFAGPITDYVNGITNRAQSSV
jgi:hypothetical protein